MGPRTSLYVPELPMSYLLVHVWSSRPQNIMLGLGNSYDVNVGHSTGAPVPENYRQARKEPGYFLQAL